MIFEVWFGFVPVGLGAGRPMTLGFGRPGGFGFGRTGVLGAGRLGGTGVGRTVVFGVGFLIGAFGTGRNLGRGLTGAVVFS
jgi:hypothetical protein